jgi:hypothetical protein
MRTDAGSLCRAFREYVALEDQAEGWEDYQDAIKEAV